MGRSSRWWALTILAVLFLAIAVAPLFDR
jgi:hypothetical protein